MTLQSLENLLTSQHARVKQNKDKLSVSEISNIYGKISADATTTYTNYLSNGYITKDEYEYAQKAFPRNLDNGKNIAQRLRGFMNIVNTEAQKPSSHQQQDMSTVSWIQPELTKIKPNMYYTYKDSHIGNGVIPSNLSSLKARTLIKILRKSARNTRVIMRTSGGRVEAIHGPSSAQQQSQSTPQSASTQPAPQQKQNQQNNPYGNANNNGQAPLTSDVNDNPKSILAFSDRTYNKNNQQTSTMPNQSQPSSSEHEVIFPSSNTTTSNPYQSNYQTQRAQQDKFAQQQANPKSLKKPTRSKKKKGGLFNHVKSFFSGRLKNVAQKIDEAKESKNVTKPPKVPTNTQGVNPNPAPQANNPQQPQNPTPQSKPNYQPNPQAQTQQSPQSQDTQIPTPPNTPYNNVNQNTQGAPKPQYQTQNSQKPSQKSSDFVANMGLNYQPTSNSNDVIENNPYSNNPQNNQNNQSTSSVFGNNNPAPQPKSNSFSQNKEQQVNNIENSVESSSSNSSIFTAPSSSSSSNSHVAHVVKVANQLSHSSSSNTLKREETNQVNKVASNNSQINSGSSSSNNSSASTSSFLQKSELDSLRRSAESSASKSVSEVISASAAKSTKAMFAKSNTSSVSSKGKEQSSMNASKQKVSKIESNQEVASSVSQSTQDSIKSSVASSADSKSKSILADQMNHDKATATKAMPKTNNIASQNSAGNTSNLAHDSEDIKDGAIGFINRFYSLNSSIRSKAAHKLHSAKIENAILNDKFNSFASKASSTSLSASSAHQKDLNNASISADIHTSTAVSSANKSAASSASSQLISNINSANSMKGSLNQSFASAKAQMTKDNDERTSVEVSSAINSAKSSVLADEQQSISSAKFQVEKANYRISYYSNQAQFHSNALSMLDSYYGDQASEIAQKAKQIDATRLLTAKFIQNNKGKQLPEIKNLKDLQNHLKNQK